MYFKLNKKLFLLFGITFGFFLGGTTELSADPQPLDNTELSEITAQDGLTLSMHLVVGATVVAGFDNGSSQSYLKLDEFGGVLDLWGMQLETSELLHPDIDSAISIGMPAFIAAEDFGFGSLGVASQPGLPVRPESSFGQMRLNGTGRMTGSLLIWAE